MRIVPWSSKEMRSSAVVVTAVQLVQLRSADSELKQMSDVIDRFDADRLPNCNILHWTAQ